MQKQNNSSYKNGLHVQSVDDKTKSPELDLNYLLAFCILVLTAFSK